MPILDKEHKMAPREATVVFFVLWLAVFAIYDILAFSRYSMEGSVSGMLRDWGEGWPTFKILVGIGMAWLWYHLFVEK